MVASEQDHLQGNEETFLMGAVCPQRKELQVDDAYSVAEKTSCGCHGFLVVASGETSAGRVDPAVSFSI